MLRVTCFLCQVNLLLPLFFLVIMTFLVVFPLFYNAVECLIGLAIIATGLPVYLVLVTWTSKPDTYRRFVGRSSFTLFSSFVKLFHVISLY